MRICYRCKEPKEESEFGINNAMSDRKSIYCKPCNREKKDLLQQRIREMRARQFWARRMAR